MEVTCRNQWATSCLQIFITRLNDHKLTFSPGEMMEAILFDMDGVLINTKPVIEIFWQDWAAKCGFSITDEQMEEYIHGVPGKQTVEALFQNEDEEIKNKILSTSAVEGVSFTELAVPGAVSMIKKLKEAGVQMGLVTSARINMATTVAKELGVLNCLSEMVTADQVKRGKPYPEPYLLAAERLKIDPSRVLVFEDSLSGTRAGIAAGMTVVGINHDHAAKSLLDLGAGVVIPDFTGIRIMDKGSAIQLIVKPEVEFELRKR